MFHSFVFGVDLCSSRTKSCSILLRNNQKFKKCFLNFIYTIIHFLTRTAINILHWKILKHSFTKFLRERHMTFLPACYTVSAQSTTQQQPAVLYQKWLPLPQQGISNFSGISWSVIFVKTFVPTVIYLLKVHNGNTRTMHKTCLFYIHDFFLDETYLDTVRELI